MSRVRKRRESSRDLRTASRVLSWSPALPILVLVVLNLHVPSLGYFWDDFYFLTFRPTVGLHSLILPDPHFFRPIPLGIYFRLLRLVDPANGSLAHGLSLALLAVTIVLLVRLVSLISGPRAGLFAGLVFAAYSPVSSLATWVSTCTDLLAILFLCAAFLQRHRGRDLAALACAGAALLCKETAIAAFPVLVLWDRLLGRPTRGGWLQVAGYGALAAAWAIVHPGIRGLAEHGLHRGSAEYVGVQPATLWAPHLVRYLMTLLNAPPAGLASSWLDERVLQAIVAFVAVLFGLLVFDRFRPSEPTTPLRRVALLSGLIWAPAVLMPAILVRHWAPYLACIPALGTSIVLGALLATRPRSVVIVAMGLFLILGARSRGIRGEREAVLSEPLMEEASQATQALRANFRTVFPEFPRGSQILASVTTTGLRGIQAVLFEGQALRVWYRDPTLQTIRIMGRRPNAPAEYLVRVTDGLDVIAIDPASGALRSSSGRAPGPEEVDPSLVSYARAAAAAGETDRAVRAMTNLNRMESGDPVAWNDRVIASMLLASGRRREADSILAVTKAFAADVSREAVLSIVSNPSPSETLDLAAFEAFGLSASDAGTVRWIMAGLMNRGMTARAAWFARRLERLAPGDAQAASILERANERGIEPSR